MSKQIRVSESIHDRLEQLARRNEQSVGRYSASALTVFAQIVERLERQAGSRLVIETADNERQEVILPFLVEHAGSETEHASESR